MFRQFQEQLFCQKTMPQDILKIIEQAAIDNSRKQILSRVVRDRIRAMVMDGTLMPGTQLPSETEMSNSIGVSRATLREALIILEHEGTVVRKQGVGTIVTSNPLLPRRYDLNLSANENLMCLGEELGVCKVDVNINNSSSELAERLNLKEGEPVIEFKMVRTVNGKPAMFLRGAFPKSILINDRSTVSIEELIGFLRSESSIFRVMENDLGLLIGHGITTCQPFFADEEIAKELVISVGSVLMSFDQIDYDYHGDPFLWFQEYHTSDIWKFTIYRKR